MPLHVLDSLSAIAAHEWDALVPDSQPFLRHAFLSALEDSGSLVVKRLDDARRRAGATPATCNLASHASQCPTPTPSSSAAMSRPCPSATSAPSSTVKLLTISKNTCQLDNCQFTKRTDGLC